jgi:cellulose synthase/poly-beta-1,6-N-acetylglucosamine synthase-like glycosyltransferase
MTLPVYYYVLGTPLGVLGLFRWSCWLIRRIPAVMYKPIVNNYRTTMSIVVPTYQEDPVIFETAIRSWLANQVEEIILVIDESDRVCQEIAARYPVTVLITDVPGKRDALRRGWNAASTDLVALVDSDTIWAPDVAAEVCKPFADPRIGGVGTRQSVYGSKGLLARLTDMFLDHRYFDENASQSLLGKAVSCLSGRTAIYRRSVLMDIEQDFMHETFWGVPCLSGDDKRLTTLTLERGHLTYMQRTAQVWSTFPDSPRVFRKQRLRWARNTWRSDLRALSNRWVWNHPFLAYTMIDKAVSGFTVLLGPIFMVWAIVLQNWIFVAVLGMWWQISRSAKLLPHLYRRPSSFFFIPAYLVFSWVMAIIKIHALLTIRKQRWLTRQVAVENGAVVRTAGAGAGAGADAEVTTEPMRHRLPARPTAPRAPASVPAPMPRRSRVAVAPPRPPRPEPRSEPRPEPRSEPRHARPSSSPQPRPEPRPTPRPTPRPAPRPAPRPQVGPQPDANPAPRSQPQPQHQPQPQPQPQHQPQPRPQPQPQSRPLPPGRSAHPGVPA